MDLSLAVKSAERPKLVPRGLRMLRRISVYCGYIACNVVVILSVILPLRLR